MPHPPSLPNAPPVPDPRWEYLSRLSLAYQLNARLISAGNRDEVARAILPDLESALGADVALLILLDAATGRPTIFGGSQELRRSLGGRLRSLPDQALRRTLHAGPDIPGRRHRVAVPVSIGPGEQGLLVIAGDTPFGYPDRVALEAVATVLGVQLHRLLLLDELDRTHRELRRVRDRGTRAQRLAALEQLSAGLAQELSRVLLPVPAYSAYLLSSDPDLTDRQRRAIRRVYDAGVEASGVLTRMRRGVERARDAQERAGPVRVEHLVAELVDRYRDRLEEDREGDRAVRVRVETEDELPRIWARSPEVADAVTQLLSNALDATRGGGRIAVRVYRAGDTEGRSERPGVVIEVADTGIGMSASTLERCRDPFFSTKADPGAGLGLSRAQSVARRFGGRLSLESVPGEGTKATLWFPEWVDDREGAPTPSLRILCLDRSPHFRAWSAQVLTFQGHRVTTSASVRRGIAAFVHALDEEEPFHVVLLGAESEHDPGPGLLDVFRSTDPEVALVLAGPWQVSRSERDGVAAVVGKPPATGVLERVVRRIARSRRPRR